MMRRIFFICSLTFVAVSFATFGLLSKHFSQHTDAVPTYLPVVTKSVVESRPKYAIEANYNPAKHEVTGHMTVRLPEARTKAWDEVYFRLYPNAFMDWKYGKESKPNYPGFLKVKQLHVDGQKVAPSIRETVMKVKLPEPLEIGKTSQIEMDYTLHLPQGGTRLNTFKNTAFLAQWYPMLAVNDQEGWHTDPYTTTGDPFYTQMSDFAVTFNLPRDYQVITSGVDPKGSQMKSQVTIKQENVRDFAAVLTKDYQVVRGKSGKTDVNLWYLKGMEDVSTALHRAAVSGLDFFGEKFGRYPYPEVDVVLGETGLGIAGMEYPGLVTSIPKIQTRKGTVPAVNVVVHELAHQWWYGVVGNNQVKEPWLDEGLTTFSEFLYMDKMMKEDERDLLRRASLRSEEIHQKLGLTAAERLDKYPDTVYGLMVYIRPAAMMYELMKEIGEPQVYKIMKTYYQQYQFKTATTGDFIRLASKVSGKNLKPFFDKWLYFRSGKAS